ncbi:MarR family winged helix-turn-helix transcriptional regulator [Mesorhizobium xinjiangense]|uniref:MarR family winged helix-turn-helix transcriptional regulator n=1 Tax=Mesorhizobium xinjiangense TaxID=2678685 RepID=UPI0012ECF264|nr:MarR family transcriptional regulator [Mesorhizobium xinjiangense]
MSPSTDPDTIGFLVGDLSRLFRAEFERRIARIGLSVTPAEARTLANIARCGSMRQHLLAERLGVEAMTLSGTLDRLESRGLIARAPDPADRRAKLVSLTQAAEDLLAEIRKVSASIRSDLSASMEDSEWERMLEKLKHVRARLIELKVQAANEEGETR